MEPRGCIDCKYFRMREPFEIFKDYPEEIGECQIKLYGLKDGDIFPGLAESWVCGGYKKDKPKVIRDLEKKLEEYKPLQLRRLCVKEKTK